MYTYKNKTDTKRFSIFKVEHEEGFIQDGGFHWDVDVWDKETGDCWTYGPEVADVFSTKREAKEWIEQEYGVIKSFSGTDTVTEGW